jgi:hypothetical protein
VREPVDFRADGIDGKNLLAARVFGERIVLVTMIADNIGSPGWH